MKENIIKSIGSIIAIIIFVILITFFRISIAGIENIESILSNIINFIAISTGFLMTTLSILASASNSKVMRRLAKFKKINQLNMFFVEPVLIAIVLVILCIVEVGLSGESILEKYISCMIIALFIAFIIDFLRIGYLCISIIQEIMDENFSKDYKIKPVDADTSKAFVKN